MHRTSSRHKWPPGGFCLPGDRPPRYSTPTPTASWGKTGKMGRKGRREAVTWNCSPGALARAHVFLIPQSLPSHPGFPHCCHRTPWQWQKTRRAFLQWAGSRDEEESHECQAMTLGFLAIPFGIYKSFFFFIKKKKNTAINGSFLSLEYFIHIIS